MNESVSEDELVVGTSWISGNGASGSSGSLPHKPKVSYLVLRMLDTATSSVLAPLCIIPCSAVYACQREWPDNAAKLVIFSYWAAADSG